jgi:hypothetical protein
MANLFKKSQKVLKSKASYPIIPFVHPITPDVASTNQVGLKMLLNLPLNQSNT